MGRKDGSAEESYEENSSDVIKFTAWNSTAYLAQNSSPTQSDNEASKTISQKCGLTGDENCKQIILEGKM